VMHPPECPCEHHDLPHLVSMADAFHQEQRETARARNESGQFLSKSEEAWSALPDAQKKLLGYRKPRKKKAKNA
jgi:hypothetical protein